jgi:Ca2+-binding RTX toxin-like protein
LFALLGGVASADRSYNTWSPPPPADEWEDSNLVTDDETGESYRVYVYIDKPFVSVGAVDETEFEFGIEYRHFESAERLDIIVTRAGVEGAVLNITINNFQSGDYGIVLTGPILLFDRIFDDDSSTDDVTYDASGIAQFNSAIRELRNDSDNYSLTEEGTFVQGRMAMTLDAAAGDAFDGSAFHISLHGSDADDILNGNDVSEYYYGGLGNDVMRGAGGDDQMFGGEGNDRFVGGAGADLLNGGKGVDTADYRPSAAGVVVNLLAGTAAGGDAMGDVLVSIENLAGSQFGDVLTGDDGVNRLQGFDGADHLIGGLGNDRLLGGLGADQLDGGAGIDTADYSTAQSAVTVNLTTGVGAGVDADGDTWVSIENIQSSDFGDVITGDAGNNRLTGGNGNDTLSGQGGIDYLLGGNGHDAMTGGTGADVFVFNAASGNDVITDFWAGQGRTDRVQFLDGQFISFADVMSHTTNGAAGAVIAITADDSLTLSGVLSSQLRADDFLFA